MNSETRDAPARPLTYRFTAREYHAMGEAGVLAPDARTELIHGRIFAMSPMGFRHALLIERLTDLFYDQYRRAARVRVRVQTPLALDRRSEPEPDVMLLRPGVSLRRLPRPEDVLLVVEVSDATYAFDCDVKVPLYAKAGVPEVWLVVPERRAVEVYRRPENGAYADTSTITADAQVAPSLLPEAPPVPLAALFADL